MPFKDPDPTDPNMLVGVVLPADAEASREMAYVFAEEFVRLGYDRERLLWVFKNSFYAGAHGAYRVLGESEILSIIDECLSVWGSIRINVQDVQDDQTPSLVLPRDAGEEERRSTCDADNVQSKFDFPSDLNGAKRLDGLNDLNAREEERDDG